MGDEGLKVSIIVPHYDQKECLERLFPTIAAQIYRNFEVIVVDNCTPDASAISLIRDFIKDKPYMHLVQNPSFTHLAGTCNEGIKLAKGEYLCFLNAETELESTFIQRNVEILDNDPGIGGLTCSIIDQYKKTLFAGGLFARGLTWLMQDGFEGTRPVEFIDFTAAFYRKDVFDKIGLFDESYVVYSEDVDFCMRMKEQTGYRICAFSEKLVTRYTGAEPPMQRYYGSRSRVLLLRRHAPQYVVNAIRSILTHDIKNLNNSAINAIAGLRGAIDGILGRTARSYR